jgi:hypothetical protein
MLLEGPMKADTGADRILATKSMSPIHDDAGGLNKGVSRLDHERSSSTDPGMKKHEKNEREDSRFKSIVVVEQWICLLLGVVCIAAGIWGAFLKLSQTYVPTLRITAVACFVMGLVLVRRAWAQF